MNQTHHRITEDPHAARQLQELRAHRPGDPTLDLELLRALRDHLRAHPDKHSQESWAEFIQTPGVPMLECTTTACAAGWTAVLTGAELIPSMTADVGMLPPLDSSEINKAVECRTPDGETHSIADYAQHALGLTDWEAETLFCWQDEPRALEFIDLLIGAAEKATANAGTLAD